MKYKIYLELAGICYMAFALAAVFSDNVEDYDVIWATVIATSGISWLMSLDQYGMKPYMNTIFAIRIGSLVILGAFTFFSAVIIFVYYHTDVLSLLGVIAGSGAILGNMRLFANRLKKSN